MRSKSKEEPNGKEKGKFSKEEKEKMKADIPSTLESIFDLPEGEGKNIFDLLGVVLGAQNKDIYAVLERTYLSDEEIAIFSDLIHKAQHGIGMENYDFPIPNIGERVVVELRARRSRAGVSSEMFERVSNGWLASLKARDDALRKERDKDKFVGG